VITGRIASREALPLSLIVKNEDSSLDLALLKFEDTSQRYFPVLLGDANITTGTQVCSGGFTQNFEYNISQGIPAGENHGHWLTDMGSNPGDSGSPVFLISGEVVGIKVGGYEKLQKLNELIPLNDAKERFFAGIPDIEKDCSLIKAASNGMLPPSELYVVMDGRKIGIVGDRFDFGCGTRRHNFDFTIKWLPPQPNIYAVSESCTTEIGTIPGTNYNLMLNIGPKPPTYAAALIGCHLVPVP
jgi:hypothetical protein